MYHRVEGRWLSIGGIFKTSPGNGVWQALGQLMKLGLYVIEPFVQRFEPAFHANHAEWHHEQNQPVKHSRDKHQDRHPPWYPGGDGEWQRHRQAPGFLAPSAQSCCFAAMLLLIPGPVTTHPQTRAAMLQDYAPWDLTFRARYAALQTRLNVIAGGLPDIHAVLPVQGCGHFAMEAALRSFLKPSDTIIIPQTGAYAERMLRLAVGAGRQAVPLSVPQNTPISAEQIADALQTHTNATHLGLIYSETSSGVVNDPVAIGKAVRDAGRHMILDAVSAFGALPVDLAVQPEIDGMIFTSNKCLEAPPGLAFVACRRDRVRECAGHADSWCFDLADILSGVERAPGTSRFTPAAHVIAALDVALARLEVETCAGRLARYQANRDTLLEGTAALGLRGCLAPADQGPIVVNIAAPDDPAWDLQHFVDALKENGVVISNFYDTTEPSFRVGCIGAISPVDMQMAVAAMGTAMAAIGVQLPQRN
jgi:2-aminoethylphosphonate-pyruvate transaminase